MNIKIRKDLEKLLLAKKKTEGVSPKWFVNELIEKSLSSMSQNLSPEISVRSFLESFDFFDEYADRWINISKLFDVYARSPHNESHNLNISGFTKLLHTYATENGYTWRLNKTMTSFFLHKTNDQEKNKEEYDSDIIFYLDNYIPLDEIIMNTELLEKVKSALPGKQISYQVIHKHKMHWAQTKRLKVIKGKFTHGRWTKFHKLTFEQQLIEESKPQRNK